MTRKRIYSLDRAKGLAIFLVVFGHLTARGEPPNNADWYLQLKEWVYLFHMPFFMFTSGAVFFYNYKQLDLTSEYWQYAIKKIDRLLPPFLIFGFIILVGKTVSSPFFHVDNINNHFFTSALDIILRPQLSVAGSLWYIYVLLLLYLVIPIFLSIFKSRLIPLLVFSAVIHFLPTDTYYFMLNRLCEYLLYFVLGMWLMDNFARYSQIIEKYWPIFFVIFIGSFFSSELLEPMYAKTIVGLCSIPAVHGLIASRLFDNDKLLLVLAKYTFVIYLLNTIAIGLTKGIILMVASWNGNMFYLYSATALAAGILLPIFVKKHIFNRSAYLSRITR